MRAGITFMGREHHGRFGGALAHIKTKGKGVYLMWDLTEWAGSVQMDDDCAGSCRRWRDRLMTNRYSQYSAPYGEPM